MKLCHDTEKLYFRGNRYTETCDDDEEEGGNKISGLKDYWKTKNCMYTGFLEESVCRGELVIGENFSVQEQSFGKNRKYLMVLKNDNRTLKSFWHKKEIYGFQNGTQEFDRLQIDFESTVKEVEMFIIFYIYLRKTAILLKSVFSSGFKVLDYRGFIRFHNQLALAIRS